MSSSYYSLMDMAIAGVPAVIFGVWQLVSINREIGRDKAAKMARETASERALPEGSGHPVGEHRLDDR